RQTRSRIAGNGSPEREGGLQDVWSRVFQHKSTWSDRELARFAHEFDRFETDCIVDVVEAVSEGADHGRQVRTNGRLELLFDLGELGLELFGRHILGRDF